MTRINCIDPTLLNGKALLAEYRELPRVFELVRKAQERGESPSDKRNPTSYTLGTGHVRFFYSRLGWLLSRPKQLVRECLARGYKIQYTQPDTLIDGIGEEWLGDWTPTETDAKINIDRITQRGGLRNG